jgi:hypothetical protein
MSLVTGSALGTTTAQTDLYIEGAPQIYFSDINGSYGFNPDSDGFYWQLSGTPAFPVYQLGCYEGVQFGDNLTINSVRCDTVGDKDVVIKRNFMELKFTLKSFFPIKLLAPWFGTAVASVVTNAGTHMEKFGIGAFDNSKYYRVYFPKVYDEVNGEYVAITGHRCKLMTAGVVNMVFGNVWTVPVVVRMMAYDTLPTAQLFCTVIRSDVNRL